MSIEAFEKHEELILISNQNVYKKSSKSSHIWVLLDFLSTHSLEISIIRLQSKLKIAEQRMMSGEPDVSLTDARARLQEKYNIALQN